MHARHVPTLRVGPAALRHGEFQRIHVGVTCRDGATVAKGTEKSGVACTPSSNPVRYHRRAGNA